MTEKILINYFKLNMMLTIPRIDGTAKYSLKWAMSVLNLQGSGDHVFNMGRQLVITLNNN